MDKRQYFEERYLKELNYDERLRLMFMECQFNIFLVLNEMSFVLVVHNCYFPE